MPLVRFDGPTHRLLAFGKQVARGETAQFTQTELRALLNRTRLHFTVLPTRRDEPEADQRRGAPHQSQQEE